MDEAWFSMKDIRKRRLADAVWVPLRVSERLQENGTYGYVGYKQEFIGVGSVAFPTANRKAAQALGWSDIGIIHNQGTWATADYYKPVDVYQHNDREDLGIDLVLVQQFSNEPAEWHLNQDIVFALNLLREGDDWVRPAENYVKVARLRRDGNRSPIALEIKNEFLRDCLCARGMFLRLATYRQRDVIVENVADVGSPRPVDERKPGERFELRISSILEGGHLEGGVALFHIGRNDVDPEEDVPLPGPETDENTTSTSRYSKREGKRLARISGEIWREEEIEPAPQSARVRGDELPTGIRYIVDAAGTAMTSEELDDEDIMRWLWFRPEVIPALVCHRGGKLEWYTDQTGGVSCSPGYSTHFGLNQIGLITVYAYDVAKLPSWQQRIWAGYNVAPEGKVSGELLSAQMKAVVADSSAPEMILPEVLVGLDDFFGTLAGVPLFRPHQEASRLLEVCHRFRAVEAGGLNALAKDLMRLVADRIDIPALHRLAPPPKGENWKSLKSLEKYLATLVGAARAQKIMGPLFGAYELRLADAHLPKAELEQALQKVNVNPTSYPIHQGYNLLDSVVRALQTVGIIMLRQIRAGEQGKE